MSQFASAGGLKDALLTMDVVDEIRHRNAELNQLAESGHDDAALKARLKALYRSQGIDVSDQVIEQGIAARRDRRYAYHRPTGWKAWLAVGWINRSRIAKRTATSVAVLFCAWLATHFLVIKPLDKRAQAMVAAVNQDVDAIPGRIASAQSAFNAAASAAKSAEVRVSNLPHGDRVAGALMTAQSTMRESEKAVAEAIRVAKETKVPRLQRTDGVTREVGGAATGTAATEHVATRVRTVESALRTAHDATTRLATATALVMEAADVSTLLDTANASVMQLHLSADAEQVRQRELAAGDAALRASDIPRARAAVGRIDRIGPNTALLATLASRISILRDDALATGVTAQDAETLDVAFARVESLLRLDTADEAGRAILEVEALVGLLSQNYTYRIVNRAGTKSGVWRYSHDSPGTRNHYLVVEALDPKGNAATLAIRNEETGSTDNVSLFAVRVPEEVYKRVGDDKQDNGIIENDVIGKKPRGRLSPSFDIPTSGGFITAW